MVLIITIAVLALIVGWSEVAVAVNTELNDISNAVGAFNQTYAYTGFTGDDAGNGKVKSRYAQSSFNDNSDTCDLNNDCQLVGGAPANTTNGG